MPGVVVWVNPTLSGGQGSPLKRRDLLRDLKNEGEPGSLNLWGSEHLRSWENRGSWTKVFVYARIRREMEGLARGVWRSGWQGRSLEVLAAIWIILNAQERVWSCDWRDTRALAVSQTQVVELSVPGLKLK